MNPKLLGEKSEARIIAALIQHDLFVLTPFGDSQRYDLVIELGDEFLRVQCKTGRLIRGAVEFPTCSSYAHRGRGRKDYRGQADLFAAYCPDNDKVYVIPVDEVGRSKCRLRVSASRNGQLDGIHCAIDYELATWARHLSPVPGPIDPARPAVPGAGVERNFGTKKNGSPGGRPACVWLRRLDSNQGHSD